MMFKIIIFLSFFFTSYSQTLMIDGTRREEIFFKNYLINDLGISNDNIVISSDEENRDKAVKLIKILPEETPLSNDIYGEIEFLEKRYLIKEINPRSNKIEEESDKLNTQIYIMLISSNQKKPYIWEDEKNVLHINNIDFLRDEKFKEIVSSFLSEYIEKNTGLKRVIEETKPVESDITGTTKPITKVLAFGVVLMFGLLMFSRKKRFGDAFKGDGR